MPVFWVASEDHDLPEVNVLHVLDQADRLLRYSLPLEAGRTMLSEVEPGPGVEKLLTDLRATLPFEIDGVVIKVDAKTDPVVFVLWGNYARKKLPLIDQSRHVVVESAHPSPMAADPRSRAPGAESASCGRSRPTRRRARSPLGRSPRGSRDR